MEEGAQIASLMITVKNMVLQQYPIEEAKFNNYVMNGFIHGQDSNLLLALQSIIHNKPARIDLAELPTICELIQDHQNNSEEAIFGQCKTEQLTSYIENTELYLLKKKIEIVINTFKVFIRRCRTDLASLWSAQTAE